MKFDRSVWVIFWLIVMITALVFQAYRAWMQPYFHTADVIGLASVLVLLYKHLMKHSETLSLAVEKAKLWLKNSTTEWSLEVHLNLVDDEEVEVVSSELERILRQKYGSDLQVYRQTTTDFDFRLPHQLTAKATVDAGEDFPCLSIHILDVAISYRDSIERIEKHFCPLFQYIEHHCHVRPDGRKYGLIALYPDGNPYFGVFIQKLKVSKVDAFNLTIKTDRDDSVLSVGRDRVELMARSLDDFRTEVVNTFRLGIGEA